MKITLRKVTKTPYEFEKTDAGVTLKGSLQHVEGKLILLEGNLLGEIEVDCSVCGDDFLYELDEELKFFISDGVYVDEENKLIDVVEAKDGELDIDELIHSEVELVKSDYHCCVDCEYGED